MCTGDMHRRGTPPATLDLGLALQYLVQAADGGNLTAQHTLGTMAEAGEGISGGPDMGAAIAWYQAAAEGGHNGAMADFAYFLEHGTGVAAVRSSSRTCPHFHHPSLASGICNAALDELVMQRNMLHALDALWMAA